MIKNEEWLMELNVFGIFFIVTKEKAIVINLAFIKVTAPLRQEVIPFVERLGQ